MIRIKVYRVKGEIVNMNLAVKYCGGCNPAYDRKKTVNTICKELNIEWAPYDEANIPDITLIVCGCSVECIKLDSYRSKYRTILINKPDQVRDVIDFIKSIKAK